MKNLGVNRYLFLFNNEFSDSILHATFLSVVWKELCRLLAMLIPFTFIPYFYANGNVIINTL